MAEETNARYAVSDDGKVMELSFGEWVQVKRSETPEGQILFLLDNEWKPAPRRIQEGLLKTEKAKLAERAMKIGMDPRDLFVEAHTPAEQNIGGAAKGLSDPLFGTAQLASRVPGVPQGMRDSIDETIAEREEFAPNNAAQFGGSVASLFIPGFLGARAARALPVISKLGPAGEAFVGGAAEGATLPVTGDNFAQEKGTQIGGSAVVAGGVTAGIKTLTKSGEVLVNARRNAENLPGQLANRQVREGSEMAIEGRRLAAEHDVPLTAGQSSDSATLKFLEQRARQSWLSKEAALDGDLVRATKMREAIEKQAGNVNSETFARRLQRSITTFVSDLANKRSASGRVMYGEIDTFAHGRQIVRADNVRETLQGIVDSVGSQTTGDAAQIAKQAQMMLDEIPMGNINKGVIPGGYTAKEALARLKSWSPYNQGNIFDNVSRGENARIKRMVYSALLEDMKAAETLGGNLGELVKRANTSWRKASENMDSVQKSALGKIVGEEVATDLFNFNTVAPEKLMDTLGRLRPSESKAVAMFMEKNMPDMLPQLRGAILKDAVDSSMELAATAGSQVSFNPGNFLRALGLTGGKRGSESTRRLMHYFGGEGSKEWKTLTDLIQLSRRLADTSGKNFSDTAAATAFFDIVRKGFTSGGNFVGAVLGTTMEGAGLKRITQSMHPLDELFGGYNARPLLEAPRVIRRSALPVGIAAGAADPLNARQQQ